MLAAIRQQSTVRITSFRVGLDHDCCRKLIAGALKLIGVTGNKTGL